MATVSFSASPLASGDDGSWRDDLAIFVTVNGEGYVGKSGNQGYHSFIRFDNLQIPPGATITSAVLTLKNIDTQGVSTVLRKLSANDVDDAVAPTTAAIAAALALTTAQVDWDTVWADGATVDSPDISAVIQEVVDRGGWAAGNAITILLKDDGTVTDNNYNTPTMFDTGANIPVLKITFTAEDWPYVNQITNLNVGVAFGQGVRTSTGKYFWKNMNSSGSNMFWYSLDGATWVNWTHTPTGFDAFSHNGPICIDAEDNIYHAYTSLPGASQQHIQVIEFSGAAPTQVDYQAIQFNGEIIREDLYVFPHPDGDSDHRMLVTLDEATLRFATYTISTHTWSTFTSVATLTSFAFITGHSAMHGSTDNPLIPAVANDPKFIVIAWSNNNDVIGRCSMEWNGTTFVAGTTRTVAVSSSWDWATLVAASSTVAYIVGLPAGQGHSNHQAWKVVDGSDATWTDIDTPSSGAPTTWNMGLLAVDKQDQAHFYIIDHGVAGVEEIVYDGSSWGAWTPILAGVGQLDSPLEIYGNNPTNGAITATVRDDAVTDNQLFVILFEDSVGGAALFTGWGFIPI